MVLDPKVMQNFIDEHHSQYVGKYKLHSGYRTEEDVFKYHYYMLDENFRQIDIFIEIQCNEQISYTFSEELHEQEKIFIVKDILQHMLSRLDYKSSLHYTLYENYIKTISQEHIILEPIDYCDILNYMKYHHGKTQETMDEYYRMFIPCLELLIKNKKYKKFMDSMHYLLRSILYEYEWDGTNSKYLDTEYQFHFYYIREVIKLVYEHLDKFYKEVPDELFKVIKLLCEHGRFSFMIMTDFGSMVLSHYKVSYDVMEALKNDLVLNDKDEELENVNLVYSYIYYIFHNNADQYHAVVLKVFRHVINYMLTFANHDLDLALGNALIKQEGYQILLDLFDEDYNTFIFSCFPISSFPRELHVKLRDELITAIQFFSARMDNDNYRLSSFEQVANINRLLMDNFKEWYK